MQNSPSALLISIKPNMVERILNGTKKYEYRKSFPQIQVKHLVIYSTYPVQKAVAVVEVLAMRENTVWAIWEGTKAEAGVSEEEYRRYYSGRAKAYAYKLGEAKLILPPAALNAVAPNLPPPQSFTVLSDELFQAFDRLTDGR